MNNSISENQNNDDAHNIGNSINDNDEDDNDDDIDTNDCALGNEVWIDVAPPPSPQEGAEGEQLEGGRIGAISPFPHVLELLRPPGIQSQPKSTNAMTKAPTRC